MIYADYNATAPLRPEARDAMLAALEVGANPSSVHGPGRQARKLMEKARGQVASAIRALPQDLIFTSGGTEAVALAIQGTVRKLDGDCTLLVSAVEHEAVSKNAGHSGVAVETLYVDETGKADLDWLADRLGRWDRSKSGTPVLVLMLANNETGVIQPVQEAAAMVRDAGGLTICDGVQGLGKLPVNVSLLGVDYLALSAHKAALKVLGRFGLAAVRLCCRSSSAVVRNVQFVPARKTFRASLVSAPQWMPLSRRCRKWKRFRAVVTRWRSGSYPKQV